MCHGCNVQYLFQNLSYITTLASLAAALEKTEGLKEVLGLKDNGTYVSNSQIDHHCTATRGPTTHKPNELRLINPTSIALLF
jgi:hypothetical protein